MSEMRLRRRSSRPINCDANVKCGKPLVERTAAQSGSVVEPPGQLTILDSGCWMLNAAYWNLDTGSGIPCWSWLCGKRQDLRRLPRPAAIAYMYVHTYVHTCPLSWHFYGIRRQTDFTSSGKRKRPVGLHCIVDRVGWSWVGANSNQLPSGDDFLNDGCSYSYPEWIECYLQAGNCHSSITIIFQNFIF